MVRSLAAQSFDSSVDARNSLTCVAETNAYVKLAVITSLPLSLLLILSVSRLLLLLLQSAFRLLFQIVFVIPLKCLERRDMNDDNSRRERLKVRGFNVLLVRSHCDHDDRSTGSTSGTRAY